jgi:hypothetical protein
MKHSHAGTILAVSLVLMCIAAPTRACSVPTFRYWLERLDADLYTVLLLHRGEPTDELTRVARRIRQAATAEPNYANVDVLMVDLDAEGNEAVKKWYAEQGEPELPHMAVIYPPVRVGWGGRPALEALLQMPTVWSGSPDLLTVDRLLDSPLRRRIVRSILSGDTAVYLLIPGSDAERNEEIRELMAEQLPLLAKRLVLPEIMPQDMQYLSSTGPELRIAFLKLEVRRDDTDEAMFLRMIRGMDAEAFDGDKPMLVPIFARGRMIPPIVGDEITKGLIEDLSFFLTGECSCEVKGQLPGVDALMTAGWAHYMASGETTRMLDEHLPAPAAPAAELVVATDRAESDTSPAEVAASLTRNVLLAAGGLVALVGLGVLVTVLRNRKETAA